MDVMPDKERAIELWRLSGSQPLDHYGICEVDGDSMLWGHDWEFTTYTDCLARTCRRCGAFCYDYGIGVVRIGPTVR